MGSDLRKTVKNALASIPSREELRLRLAENLQERQLIRKLLRLAEQREQAAKMTGGDDNAETFERPTIPERQARGRRRAAIHLRWPRRGAEWPRRRATLPVPGRKEAAYP